MDTTSPKYIKYKKILLDIGLLIAILVLLTGTVFIGVVIGEGTARSAAEKQRTELTESYREIIATKDQLITSLSQSNVKATDAIVTVTTQQNQTAEVVKNAVARSDQAIQTASKAANKAADAAAVAADAKKAKVAEDAKKLKDLK